MAGNAFSRTGHSMPTGALWKQKGYTKMKRIHVTTAECTFDIEVPADQAQARAAEIAVETEGIATL